MRAWLTCVFLAVWAAYPTQLKAQEYCSLALVLALDVSSSVDAEEHKLQRDGLAAALDNFEIRSAILDGPGIVSIAIYEWSGRDQSVMITDWVALHNNSAINGVIGNLKSVPRSHERYPTAMGYALGFGATLLARGPTCDRKVIDLSGDGQNNDGFAPYLAYKNFPFENVTVNGLAVLTDAPDVLDYFYREVRFGAGAFVETSKGYVGYQDAMTRKLFREINGLVVTAKPSTALRPG